MLVRFPAFALIVACTVIPTNVHAQGEASRYVLVPPGAREINSSRDYFSISLVQGWLSTRHSFLERLLSNTSKFTVLVQGHADFFDGQKIEVAYTFSNTDIRANVSKAWGMNPQVFPKLPADAGTTLLTRLAVYQEDRTATLLAELDRSKAFLPADLFAGQALGYAQVVSGVFRALFGTDKTKYPFLWEGDVLSSPVARTQDGFKEHYIVLVAPRSADDNTYLQLDPAKLSFDVNSQRLQYDGQFVTDWSFAVFYVRKEDPYDLMLLTNQSTAPWATLAVSVFRAVPVDEAGTAQELRTLAKGLVTQLTTELDLLKRELRFSAYSRSVMLASLAGTARDLILERCQSLSIATAECPVGQLTQLAATATRAFGLPERLQGGVLEDAAKLSRTLRLRGPGGPM